ncbi:MAG TPA: SBBP repeat-containing protein, partial [Blastocatellia bacterium]|nr:SBBP repeat-containing protein [Blastocatellia bacterium]
KPLTIDPVLIYSTLMGGNDQFREIDRAGDKGLSIAVDGAGNTYITGETFSSDFPAPSPIQAQHGGSFADAFVAKLNATGTALVYSTYLGGTGRDSGNDIAVDSMGQASVIGTTRSSDFPTLDALQPASNLDTEPFLQKAFIAKLNASGDGLIFSTYLAGDGSSSGEGIATDATGNIYAAGSADAANFPFTPGAFQSTGFSSGAFVTKFNPTGSALVYSAFIGGGSPDSLALDPSGNTYITGRTFTTSFPTTAGSFMPVVDGGSLFYSFVTKLNSSGSALAYSTFIGDDVADMTTGIAVDSSGNAFLTGLTTAFPTTPAAFATLIGTGGSLDGFVRKLNASGSALIYSTNFGGSNVEVSNDVAVDGAGNAYVTGLTFSSDYPLVSPLQTRRASIFAAKLNPTGTAFVYSTFFGGSVFNEFETGSAIAVDPAGSAYFTGIAEQADFPTTPGALQSDRRGITDAFVAKIASFDACLEDESGSDILLFDSGTGNYQFTSCRFGVSFAGTGRISRRGCLVFIEEFQADHRISAHLDTCRGKGTASVRSFSVNKSFTITDRSTADNACRCR